MNSTRKCPRLKKPIVVFMMACAALVTGCTSIEQQDAQIRSALESVQAGFAPDRRVAVFDITWERGPSGLIVKGEVQHDGARRKALEVLEEISGTTVVDSIQTLPQAALSHKPFGIITVSVGNMRARPRHSAELVTQVLMGMPVRLMKKQGGWYYVQSADQYLGWIEEESMTTVSEGDLHLWQLADRLVTIVTVGLVTDQPAVTARPVSDIVVGCTFKALGRVGRWIAVELPDGRKGYVDASSVQKLDTWKRTRVLTSESVESSAVSFMGVPYLWGGTSAKGFDCSGFTKTVYRMNGLELNRDANQQALQGEEIMNSRDWKNLRKGDLLFFGREATESSPERIVHVGIYLSNGAYIHCSGRVRVNSLDPDDPNYDEYNQKRFVRARRVIGVHSIPEVF